MGLDFQILDVQVVDSLPASMGVCSPEDLQGESFNEHRSNLRRTYLNNCMVLMFGRTFEGQSVLLRIRGFRPYMYRRANNRQSDRVLNEVRQQLSNSVHESERDNVQVQTTQKQHMYGWVPNEDGTDRKRFQYFKVSFPTVRAFKDARRNQGHWHEHKISPETKFMDDMGLDQSGWVRVSASKECRDRISHCALEFECSLSDIVPLEEEKIAPLVTGCFDIECISHTNQFPDANNPKDRISMIGMVYWTVGTPAATASKHIFTIRPCGGECMLENAAGKTVDGMKRVQIHCCETEAGVLRAFRDSIVQNDPDILVGYNNFGFDLQYLWTRAELCEGGPLADFHYLSRLVTEVCTTTCKELTSSALGANNLFLVNMPGRCNLDMFQWIKSREKFDSYKLDNVCEAVLGEKKLAMDYKELFRISVGTPDEVAHASAYCVQDCYLLVQLMVHFQTVAANIAMSRVCHTAMETLVTRGQTIKVVNQLIYYGHREGCDARGDRGYIMNTPDSLSGDASDKLQGATVVEAQVGYYKAPVAVLDFMSLYPSIIMHNNFCFSTLVQDEAHLEALKHPNAAHIEVVRMTVNGKAYTWIKNMPGLIPLCMRKLLAARKASKRSMANAPDAATREVFNAKQKAEKISANSIYGFTGALLTNDYHCLAVADCVTYRAREMLHDTMRYANEYTKCRVIYGDTDSIMVIFDGSQDTNTAFDIGDKTAEFITAKFDSDCIVLEMEKVYCPYLLVNKKRYAGLMHVRGKGGQVIEDSLDVKGIEVVRRDNCAVAKRVQQGVLDHLIRQRDPLGAIAFLDRELCEISRDRVPVQDYLISKGRSKVYANELSQAHMRVVNDMRSRNPGSEPQVGDRVPYILVQTRDQKAKASDKAQELKWALAQGMKIDRLYYVEHQIRKPVTALLELAVDTNALFDSTLRSLMQQQTKQVSVCNFLETSTSLCEDYPAALPLAVTPAAEKSSRPMPTVSRNGNLAAFLTTVDGRDGVGAHEFMDLPAIANAVSKRRKKKR